MKSALRLEEHLKSCTVSVHCGNSRGTGFFIAQGRVVTNLHVLERGGRLKIEVVWNGDPFPAERIELRVPEGLSENAPDLALLAIDCPRNPVVVIAEDHQVGDSLYCYGFTKEYPNGEPATTVLEGVSEKPTLLKLKLGQIRPGLSGAPILNLRTGAVCGILKSTRDRGTDLGGRGVPAATLLAVLPEDMIYARAVRDRQWTRLLTLRQRWWLAPRALRVLPLAGLVLLLGITMVSWVTRPSLWHRILGTPVLVLPFSPPPSLPDERPISDQIVQALARQVREEAGLKPVFAEIARPIASTLGIRGPCLHPDLVRQVRRSTGADFVLFGSFEVFHDEQPSKMTACFQGTIVTSKSAIRSYHLVKGEDEIEPVAADVGRWIRSSIGPPSLSLWWNRHAPDERAVLSYFEGVAHLQRFELKAAQKKLEDAVKRNGDFYPAHRELSRLWQILGNDGAALDEAQRALVLLKRLDSADPREESLLQAHLLTTQGEWDQAALVLQAAWNREPQAGEIAVRLAEAQNQAGTPKQARLSIQKARGRQVLGRLALTPEMDANLDLEEATAYFWLGETQQQLQVARRALGKLLRLPEYRDLLISRATYFECIALTELESEWPKECTKAIQRFSLKHDQINEAKFLALRAGWLLKGGDENKHWAELLDRRVLNVYRKQEFTRGIIDQATNLAYTLSDLDQDAEARTLCQEALRLARQHRSLNLPTVLSDCAYFDLMDHNLDLSRRRYIEALDLFQRRGDLSLKAVALGNLAYVDHASGEYTRAIQSYEESLRLSQATEDLGWDYGETLVRFARLLLDSNREQEARRRLQEAWNCYLTDEEQISDLPKVYKSIDRILGRKQAWTQMVADELTGPRNSKSCRPVKNWEPEEPEPAAGMDA